MQNIRNFCIIAHIDHWKSTLADRLLEITWTVEKVKHWQVLDKMDLEQERWITIKLTPARMRWKDYELNLIDTPGHVDFQYEVSRSLASVEGAILLVDATQWIQAQTLSTLYMAIDYWLEIIPVLNKIDLPAANPERVAQEIENLIGLPAQDIIKISAKTWENVEKVLEAIVERIPSPTIEKFWLSNVYDKFWYKDLHSFVDYLETSYNFWRALIFDSVYDKYRWVVLYVRVVDWQFKVWDKIKLLHSNREVEIKSVWYFAPDYVDTQILWKWEIWYIVTWLKTTRDAQVWDTVLKFEKKIDTKDEKYYEFVEKAKDIFLISWFKKVKPFIYAWVYPIDTEDYEKLRDWFEKLSLNDSAIVWEPEVSKALWQWFRAWFLWTLHMDIVKERLRREFDVETIFTTPNVIYLVKTKNYKTVFEKTKWQNLIELIKTGLIKYVLTFENIDFDVSKLDSLKNVTDQFDSWNSILISPNDLEQLEKLYPELKFWMVVRSPADMPENGDIDQILEPIVDVEIVGPSEFSWNIMELAQEYRWEMKNMEYIDDTRVLRKYTMPMGEIIVDFYDRLKSSTKGYATMNYEFIGYQSSDLVRLDILVNNERVESFSLVVHKDKAYYIWREIVKKLKELIPKHLFPIPLQAAIWTKIIARETIPALKKDVLAKCYWWDVTRKRKLLQKQKEWKKRLKQMWKVSVPNDIFIKMIQR